MEDPLCLCAEVLGTVLRTSGIDIAKMAARLAIDRRFLYSIRFEFS